MRYETNVPHCIYPIESNLPLSAISKNNTHCSPMILLNKKKLMRRLICFSGGMHPPKNQYIRLHADARIN